MTMRPYVRVRVRLRRSEAAGARMFGFLPPAATSDELRPCPAALLESGDRRGLEATTPWDRHALKDRCDLIRSALGNRQDSNTIIVSNTPTPMIG